MAEKHRQLEIITPATMTFVFHLSKGECHKQHTGTCSLDRHVPDRSRDQGEESDYGFCPTLLNKLTREYSAAMARTLPIDIIRFKCGHWEFSDGQHRTCIAKRKNLTVEAEISTDSKRLCAFCRGDAPDYTVVW